MAVQSGQMLGDRRVQKSERFRVIGGGESETEIPRAWQRLTASSTLHVWKAIDFNHNSKAIGTGKGIIKS
jgi:hypothetical protein